MRDNLAGFRPIGYTYGGVAHPFEEASVSLVTCPQCGHVFDASVRKVPPMPDPPPKNPITLIPPPEEHPVPGP